ncbi:MAG: CRTAC1 family protein [Vicinamibacteraceae bacterium]
MASTASRFQRRGRLATVTSALIGVVLIQPGATEPQIRFVDVAADWGIHFTHENGASPDKIMVETFGSGVATFDYDNDGWVDVFFANGANLSTGTPSPGNVLYRNTGKGRFVDVTRQAGVVGNGRFATGVAVGDIDNDGFLDLYVGGYGGGLLYRNNGRGRFTNVTTRAGVAATGWISSAGFFDFNRDGDLDLYVTRYLDYDARRGPYCGHRKDGYRMYCDPRNFDGVPDLLYRNNGDGTFVDVSHAAGIANPAGKGLGVAFGDVNSDGWPDIYVANDLVRNFLYVNNGDGTFTDATYAAGVGYDENGKPQAGMGAEIADYDGDGWLDIFVTNFSEELNELYRNAGDLVFEDTTRAAGLGAAWLYLGFGTKLFDANNDGNLDIHVTNGHVIDNIALYTSKLSYEQTDQLFLNRGGGRFVDVSAEAGPAFRMEHVGRGSAVADLDNDGRLEIIVADAGGAPIVMRNDGQDGNHWLRVLARGRVSNRFGVGARVAVEAGGRRQIREIGAAGSYLSASDLRLHVGLGRNDTVDRLTIHWPSGRRQTLERVAGNQQVVLDEQDAR